MRAYKKLFNTKNITQTKLGKRQHYSKFNRVKAKLYVSIMYRLRGLIMELYILPSSNGCDSSLFKIINLKKIQLLRESYYCSSLPGGGRGILYIFFIGTNTTQRSVVVELRRMTYFGGSNKNYYIVLGFYIA